jgi:hypothetical protein
MRKRYVHSDRPVKAQLTRLQDTPRPAPPADDHRHNEAPPRCLPHRHPRPRPPDRRQRLVRIHRHCDLRQVDAGQPRMRRNLLERESRRFDLLRHFCVHVDIAGHRERYSVHISRRDLWRYVPYAGIGRRD